MRFAAIAGAVVVTVSVAGCKGSAGPSSPGGNRGVEAATFRIVVRGETAVLDPATSTTIILPGGGLVTSSVGGIDCGIVGPTLHKACSATLAYGTRAVLVTAAPDSSAGYAFFEWAGACTGSYPCRVDVTSDRLVVVRFAKTVLGLGAHPNFTDPSIHGPAYVNDSLPCTGCHGANLKGQGLAPSCAGCHAFPMAHTPGSDCGSCHASVLTEWASVVTSADKHAASAADVLLNVEHDSSELLVDACLNCHSMFQRVAGDTIDQFVTPIDTVVPLGQVAPAGTWTLVPGAPAWQATRCEVCHDVTSTAKGKLSKYGALLDADPAGPSYFDTASLPQPSQSVFDPAHDAYVDTPYLSTTSTGVAAVKLCYTCHDPADQGDDANHAVVAGHDYGPQGGDSRAFVTASHAGLTCVDCHPTHDFTPVDADIRPACATAGCHDASKAGTAPGVVHTNHIE
jgi:hypothetical protein